ncbi:MAG: protoheme IX farnesyltransferase [Ferrovum sp.]|nr:protoheme IX farnesyltransferase [Ferrovum sp.]NDU87488.1 protoheme IX farnesyltransferase [Ferrovum sp.]
MSTLSLRAPATLRDYLSLIKPGIVLGNLVSVVGGVGLATHGHAPVEGFFAILWGAALIISAGCVFNNYIDRDIDALMGRTHQRPLAQGRIGAASALTLGGVLLTTGLSILMARTSSLTVTIGVAGLVIYVGLYSLIFKRQSGLGTWVGSVAGAVPPLLGYTAFSHHFDLGAWLLLGIFCLWQIPHAYAIGILHLEDYRRAAIPVLPVTHGSAAVRARMLGYVTAFSVMTLLPAFSGLAGIPYFLVMSAVGLSWMGWTWSQRGIANDRRWARGHFVFSLAAIMSVNAMLVLSH